MEFPGIGILSLETPAEELKDFFKKKFKTAFRAYAPTDGGPLIMGNMEKLTKRIASHSPVEDQKRIFEEQFEAYRKLILLGRESITEEEFVKEWMDVAFGNEKQKREFAEQIKVLWKVVFQTVDTNKDGIINYEEFRTWYELRSASHGMTKTVFDAIDADKDGVITFQEWTYAFMMFIFRSGPDSVFSLWYGPLVEDE